VCYLDEEDNALFTGDTLFKESIGRTDLYGGDSSSVYPSLTKLTYLNEMLVCFPGHGSVTTIKTEKANNPFLH
jgi:glyoxylase-like metal-dependent hydrolase (beta-lactamase superfamily II)